MTTSDTQAILDELTRLETLLHEQTGKTHEEHKKALSKVAVKRGGTVFYEVCVTLVTDASREAVIGLGAAGLVIEHIGPLVTIPVVVSVLCVVRVLLSRVGGLE